MKNSSYLVASFALTLFAFISCTKEDVTTPPATDNNSAVVASASIDLINELDVQTGNQVSFDNLTSRKTKKAVPTSCSTVTMDPVTTTFPKTYYVDFGVGCTTNNITRKGKLKITFSNNITETGSTMTVERINYYVNGNKAEGKIVYTNTTVNANTPQWTRTVTEGIFTTATCVYTNSGSHTIKQTAGVATALSLEDNTYEMTDGTHTVSKQNGDTLTLTVLEALVKNYNCDYISKGKLTVQSILLNGVIDYGTGECDNKATYTQSDIAFPFTM